MYTYAGLAIPTILLMTLGAAIAGAIPNAPAWQAGYDKNLVGGILAAMLQPAGGFGKFVVVVLSLTLLGNTAGTMYAITLNFQTLVPWLVRVPRYVFALVITAIVIPVAVRAVAQDFFVSLENFVALIGYWSASFVGIVGTEHLAFRRRRRVPGDPDGGYNHAVWADAGKLPWGVAALASGVLCFGMVVPCMEQVWWTGPIAKTTGDLGFELAFVLSAMFYVPLRLLEQKFTGR